ncbi:MAG: TrbI F-type domain-containing protein [Rhodospirillales bacterium]|nr:TrbI F-type domain-containing protein [Rhodospirillales bacterium]MDE0378138.1 TrbI F-type domain-containing protein [Rhodospirillales bacterium]
MDWRDPAWPVMVSTLLLSGAVAAVVAAATLRYGAEEPPRVASVRLGEITTAYTTRAASEGRTAEEVRAWGAALETALDRVAKRHGLVLLPARAVAAGAPDKTPEVEAMLVAILARAASARAASPGDGR